MRITILPLVIVLALVACNKKVLSPTTTKEDGFAGAAAGNGNGQILYHGMTVRAADLVVLNDRKPVYPDSLGPNQNEVLIASTDPGATTNPVTTEPTDDGLMDGLALQGETDYIRRCRAAGVPIPPAWTGDETGGWKSKGEMTDVFVSKTATKTVLWSYVDAAETGQCAALPRYNGDQIDLFGVICANLTTGDTCFWDNVTAAGGGVAVVPGYTVADGLGADQLGENCSNCHRGDNPWIVNPGQPSDQLRVPKGRYRPLGTAAWVNPVPANPVKGCSVSGCHNMPELTDNYCVIGLDFIEAGVMPYDGGTAGVVEFRTACQKLMSGGFGVPAGGSTDVDGGDSF